jgi:hypothetical protein
VLAFAAAASSTGWLCEGGAGVRIREHEGALEAEDTPGLHWLLGLLFVGVGSVFVAGPLGAFNDAERLEWWQRALAAAFGAGGVAAGLWTLARAPHSRLTVDVSGARVRLERWGFGGRVVREGPLSAVTGVKLVEGRDDEGGEMFQLHLLLRATEPVPISPVWCHGRQPMEDAANRLAAGARVPVVNVHRV